ncbi:histidine kinase OS=Ureibacillus acetophenoni OX=614649 GN=SAMN05877842_11026 PE=4 SV=1 [Ureibacillus acetophenoni]
MLKKWSLQNQMILMTTLLILLITVIFSIFFIKFEVESTFDETESIALQSANALGLISHLDTQSKNFKWNKSANVLRIKDKIDADLILLEYRDGLQIEVNEDVHFNETDPYLNDNNYMALVFGGNYIVKEVIDNKEMILAKAPIMSETKEVAGVVTIGFDKQKVIYKFLKEMTPFIWFTFGILVLGFILSYFFAKHIRKKTLGLEPEEITNLYMARNSVLQSVNEGIISLNNENKVTLINYAAYKIFESNDSSQSVDVLIDEFIQELLQENKLYRLNEERVLNKKYILLNVTPIVEKNETLGTVLTMSEITEYRKILTAYKEIKTYSDELRAQTHEFTNKLYAISGLLQLKEYDEAVKLIQKQSNKQDIQNEILFNQIQDKNIQAILVGKLAKASEMKIKFYIDENSYIDSPIEHIDQNDLIVLLSNLIDNAIEAVNPFGGGVTFFASDIGDEIIFEISDDGPGINIDNIQNIFEKGISSKKEKDHGFGLYNVKNIVQKYNGVIELNQEQLTIFTVSIPKIPKLNEVIL